MGLLVGIGSPLCFTLWYGLDRLVVGGTYLRPVGAENDREKLIRLVLSSKGGGWID